MKGDGTYLKVFDRLDGCVICTPEDEPRLDAAVTTWITTHRDVLIDLTMIEGCSYKTLASTIGSWCLSTPESRSRRVAIDHESETEYQTLRRAEGIWDDE